MSSLPLWELIKILIEDKTMPSIFGYANESADGQDDSQQQTVADENVAGLSEAVMEEHDEMMKTSDSIDELVDGEDKLNELVDVASESYSHNGLSERGLQYLKIAFTNIVGKPIANKRTPAMESFAITNPLHITAIALEGIMDTIKQFWEAIKNQMNKFWNQTKTWYVKTFDVANKIIARSKTLDDKAQTLTTSPTEKSFEMSGVMFLAVNYQVKDPAPLLKGLVDLKNILDASLLNITKSNQANKTDNILNATKAMLVAGRADATNQANGKPFNFSVFNEMFDETEEESGLTKLLTTQASDPELMKKLSVGQGLAVFESQSLPGNRKLYKIVNTQKTPTADLNAIVELVKAHRLVLSDASSKPKEMEDSADVKTLNSSQISQLAGVTGEMGETMLGYKKEFEARDKYIKNIIKGFDSIVKELEGSAVEQPKPPKPAPTPAAPAAPAAPATPATPAAPATAPTTATPPATGAPAAATNPPTAATPAATTQQDGEGDLDNPVKPNEDVDKSVRKLANCVLQQFKKQIALSGTILTHSIKVANAFLLYGERSLAQYGG